jgi:MoxR-like ATPase
VIPEDVKQVSKNVLTHRFVLTYEAIVDDITAENIVLQILDKVQVN